MRVINRTIRLRNIFLDKHAAMFEVRLFPRLRSPETFAGSKLLRLASKTRELSEGATLGSNPNPHPQPQPPTPTLTPTLTPPHPTSLPAPPPTPRHDALLQGRHPHVPHRARPLS